MSTAGHELMRHLLKPRVVAVAVDFRKSLIATFISQPQPDDSSWPMPTA